jgi:hypothetical protein
MWRVLSIAFLGLSSLSMLASDLTSTTSFESTGPTGHTMQHSSTLMIHDQRSRAVGQNYAGDGHGNQTYGPRFAMIQQCDLKQNMTVDLDNQVYSVHPLPNGPTRAEYEAAAAKAKAQPKPQFTETLTITTEVVDTGETKLIFGRVAHHYKIHIKREPSAGANAEAREEFTDGWYIEIPEYQRLRGCNPFAELEGPKTQHAVLVSSSSEPINYRVIQKSSGPAMTGSYPADIVMTTRAWVKHTDGSVHEYTNISKEKITVLSTDPLDPALFDAPRGYARVSEVKISPTPSWIYRAGVAWAKFWNLFGL